MYEVVVIDKELRSSQNLETFQCENEIKWNLKVAQSRGVSFSFIERESEKKELPTRNSPIYERVREHHNVRSYYDISSCSLA